MSEAVAYTHKVIRRKARPADIKAVAELGIEALQSFGYPNLVIDPDKVHAVAREVITGAGNYCQVAVRDGIVVGALSALVHEQLFYERRQASVVQFYCKSPPHGLFLIRDFLTWARARPGIKTIVFTLEMRADPSIAKLLARLGLSNEFPVMMEIR